MQDSFVIFDNFKNEKTLANLSGAIKQYIEFKQENEDSIILFQSGAFYEVYFDDAELFSQIIGVDIGVRKFKLGKYYATGIPCGSLHVTIKKLLDANLKVCLCKQYESLDGGHYRKIIRKYTQGTICEKELLDSFENNYIASLYLDKNICNLSYADVSTGQFYKTHTSMKEIETELFKISPCELLIDESQKDIFKNLTDKYNVTLLKSNYFNKSVDEAILNYCSQVQKDFASKLDKIKTYKIENFMILDESTRRNLELTRTKSQLKKKGSLFWFLNYTKTPMGARALKKYLNEPLLNKNLILERQDAVDELINKKEILLKLENILTNFADLSRICARISNSTIQPKDLFQIVLSSKKLYEIYDICNNLKSKLMKFESEKINEILILSDEIEKAIFFYTSIDENDNRKINDNYDANLDYLRGELKKAESEITKFDLAQKRKLKDDKVCVNYIKARGYFIEIPAHKNLLIPSEYMLYQANKTYKRYQTDELIELQEKIFNLKYKIQELENEIYKKIVSLAKKFIDDIRIVAAEISKIDVFVALARCAMDNNLSRPEIIMSGIKIIEGFHPSLIKLNNYVVKNNTDINDESIIILTGANMSGKSTYLKHNAIIALLTQIGSYVPAKNAKMPIVDKIFLRQGSNDDIINNNSSFMVEMNELKFIIDNTTKNSLIILDEPAKSTSTEEGGAIVKAFCDYIIMNIKAKTIIATHNFDITMLENKYPDKILNYVLGQTGTEYNDRKLRRGVAKTSCALSTAQLAGLPEEIIQNARNYMKN